MPEPNKTFSLHRPKAISIYIENKQDQKNRNPSNSNTKSQKKRGRQWVSFKSIFPAGYHNKLLLENHPRLQSNPNENPSNKLDIQQRNTYNRNNNSNLSRTSRYHSQDQPVQPPPTHHPPQKHPQQSPVPAIMVKGHQTTSSLSSALQSSLSQVAQPQVAPPSQSSHYDSYVTESSLVQSWDDASMSSSAATDSRRFTERRKKTVRFDGQDSDDWSQYESDRQGSQDSATKDSGIDTCSTFTSSEDSNRGDGPKVQNA